MCAQMMVLQTIRGNIITKNNRILNCPVILLFDDEFTGRSIFWKLFFFTGVDDVGPEVRILLFNYVTEASKPGNSKREEFFNFRNIRNKLAH